MGIEWVEHIRAVFTCAKAKAAPKLLLEDVQEGAPPITAAAALGPEAGLLQQPVVAQLQHLGARLIPFSCHDCQPLERLDCSPQRCAVLKQNGSAAGCGAEGGGGRGGGSHDPSRLSWSEHPIASCDPSLLP